jgi:integrase
LYGRSPARQFGPLALEAVRNKMIDKGWCRATINKAICRIRHAFKWAVSKELIRPDVYQGLSSLAGLRAGRSAAKDRPPVQPVSDAVVDATLPHMSRIIAAMVQIQRLTGARPGEICSMKTGEINRTPRPDGVWSYHPAAHKTSFRGHRRVIPIGPRAQKILLPFFKLDPSVFCFSPEEAEQDRRAELNARRKTPLNYGNRPGTNRKRMPKWKPRDRYDVDSYRKAIQRACERAFQPPPPLGRREDESVRAWRERLTCEHKQEFRRWRTENSWHPHQLRHSAATSVRREFGLESAQVMLGHTTLSATEIYAERNQEAAFQIAAKIG